MEFLELDKTQNELEIQILSCLLNSHFETEDIFLELNENDFLNPNHAKIFTACKSLMTDGKNYSFVDVSDYFYQNQSNKKIYFNEFHNYLEKINNNFSFDSSILNLIDIVKKNSVNKKLKDFGFRLTKFEMDLTNYNDKIYEIQTEFLEILNSRKNHDVKTLGEILPEYQNKLKNAILGESSLTGCTSGYPEIDQITHGFQPGDMIVLAARPGMGKTALAINFMINAASQFYDENNKNKTLKPKAILMFSMEMGSDQICERILAAKACVDITAIRRGTTTSLEQVSINASISELSNYPILIDDSSNLSIIEVQSKIKQVALTYDLGLVIIDYLQLLKGPQVKNMQSNRQQEVSNISRIIKQIARQYEVPILAIAQLSRKIEERKADSKRPILSDLRESGSIEQDADIVSFINYKVVEEEKTPEPSSETMVEYIIAKHRNGETAIVELAFKKSIGRYLSVRK